ncbi:MAG: hypothetical protein JKY48_02620 [Flavobacteriales bacterium]|nr:hypothetical protein [Flavobacteriales bacterium]
MSLKVKREKYNDKELVEMLFDTERTETLAINYILEKNKHYVSKVILTSNGTQGDINVVLNEGLVILINNIRDLKFRADSSLHTYYVGICKLLWKKLQTKNILYLKRNDTLEKHAETGVLSELIEKFEMQNENSKTLNFIYSLITDICRDVLNLWARGYSMVEISNRMGYKNSQIAMNKKNTCLKGIIEQIKRIKHGSE